MFGLNYRREYLICVVNTYHQIMREGSNRRNLIFCDGFLPEISGQKQPFCTPLTQLGEDEKYDQCIIEDIVHKRK